MTGRTEQVPVIDDVVEPIEVLDAFESSEVAPVVRIVEPLPAADNERPAGPRICRCSAHPLATAVVKCDRCMLRFCEDCRVSDPRALSAADLCECGGRWISTTLDEQGFSRTSFERNLDAAFRFPLKDCAWKGLLPGTAILGVLLNLVVVPDVGYGIVAAITCYLGTYLCRLIQESSRGSTRPPAISYVDLMHLGFWRSFAWVSFALFVLIGPGLTVLGLSLAPLPISILVLVAGVLMAPVACARLAHQECFKALDPVAIVRTIARHSSQYFTAWMLFLAAGTGIITGLLVSTAIPVAGMVLGMIAAMYFLVVFGRILGVSRIGA